MTVMMMTYILLLVIGPWVVDGKKSVAKLEKPSMEATSH